MTNTSTIKTVLLGIGLVLTTLTFGQKEKKAPKNKFLEGKVYNVNFTEVKATASAKPPKPLPSAIVLKGGKIQCDLMEEKLTLPPMQYTVTLDTTYTEDESEIHKVEFNSEFTEEKTTYKWESVITDVTIEGSCVMLKGGVQKKKFEFTGEEKSKKK